MTAARSAVLWPTPAFILVALCLSGCATVSAPDLGGIYNRAARHQSPERNPVIVIPGMLGSQLADRQGSGEIVWGAFAGGAASPASPRGARQIALPMRLGADLRELRDEVEPIKVLDQFRMSILGTPIVLRVYVHLLGILGVGGYQAEELASEIDYPDDHYTCFQFPYDWRRDLPENAQRLHEFILEKRRFVESQNLKRFGRSVALVKFDVVAHSAGGVLLRYYLRYGPADLPADGSVPVQNWAGAEQIERAILIAPPNAGLIEPFQGLIEGKRFHWLLPAYEPAIIGTMPAVYQLLPRARHGAVEVSESGRRDRADPLSFDTWVQMGWGLADPRQEEVLRVLLPRIKDAAQRRQIALDHLRKCLDRAQQFQASIDQPAAAPEGLTLHLIVADADPTPAEVLFDRKSRRLRVTRRGPGDGSVLRTSALMDERVGQHWQPRLLSPIRWTSVRLLFTSHLGMTRDPALTDNVLYLLLQDPRRGTVGSNKDHADAAILATLSKLEERMQ